MAQDRDAGTGSPSNLDRVDKTLQFRPALALSRRAELQYAERICRSNGGDTPSLWRRKARYRHPAGVSARDRRDCRCSANLLGGSADLTHSNLTRAKAHRPVRHDCFEGSYIHYGVREHAMAAAMNGIALHGGFIPYGGTFLTFADYSRPAIRLAALMGVRVVHAMTHDLIGLGEDGRLTSRSSILYRCGRFPICSCSVPAMP